MKNQTSTQPFPQNRFHVSTVDNYEEAIDALNSGRHCIVQKAFPQESGHAETLLTLARNKGLNIFVWKVPPPLRAQNPCSDPVTGTQCVA
jgi:hypothetical protein